MATAPKQVWSWDITKLRGPEKWTYYYLYVMIDVYSRYATGWMVATRETGKLATRFVAKTCLREEIGMGQLTIHSDRGSPMTSKALAFLLADLGVTKSLSRPHVSDDNPYSESQFHTVKSHPTFPERFESLEEAQAFCKSFFDWYNNDHYHSGIGYMTPAVRHHGLDEECNRDRQEVLTQAYKENPERFVRGMPKTFKLPKAAWINPPKLSDEQALLDSITGSGTIIGTVR